MEKKINRINEFIARGVITGFSSDVYGNRVIQVAVHGRRYTATLNLIMEPGIGYGLHPYQHVILKGYTRAYSYFNEAVQKNVDTMYFVCTEVEPDKTLLAQRFGSEFAGQKFYSEAFFTAYISGKVVRAFKNPKAPQWGKLVVETSGGNLDRRPSYVSLSYMIGQRLPAFDYLPGDEVCIQASAFTPEKKKKSAKNEERTIVFQNLTVENIAYISKVERNGETGNANTTAAPAPEFRDPYSLHFTSMEELDEVMSGEITPDEAEVNAEIERAAKADASSTGTVFQKPAQKSEMPAKDGQDKPEEKGKKKGLFSGLFPFASETKDKESVTSSPENKEQKTDVAKSIFESTNFADDSDLFE